MHKGFWFAIFTSVLALASFAAGFFGSSVAAWAQVDLNLQTAVGIVSPPPATLTPQISSTVVVAPPDCTDPRDLKRAAETIRSLLSNKNGSVFQSFRVHPELNEELRAHSKDLETYLSNNPQLCKFLIPLPHTALNRNGQPTAVLVNLPANPTYETDVLKKGSNSSPGSSDGLGGNVLVTNAGLPGRPFDLTAFAAGSASARYPSFPTQSLDTASMYAAYQFFIDAYQYNEEDGTRQYITPDNNVVPQPANMITVDTLALEVLNQTAYTPTYDKEKANLFTPQFILSRQNIDLSDDTQCFPEYNQRPNAPNQGFCYFANVSLALGQTFSDVLSQQNANLAASASLGWRIPNSDWNLSLQSTATARHYEDFIGGREDLLLQSGPVLTFAPSSNFTFSLPITYFKNYSTVSAAAWSGIIVQPTLTIAFTYPSK